MTEKNIKNQVIEGLVGWMEDLEGATGEELREIRHELGHDVKKSEREFTCFLKYEYEKLGIELISEADTPPPEVASAIKPYLGYVSDETGLPPSKIAQVVGSTREFLIQVTQHSEMVEDSVCEEICDRTVRQFPQLNRAKVLRSLRQRSEKIAAARNTEYSNAEITFEHILGSSGLTEEQQTYWRNVAKGGNR
jgi:hypothetical protein